MTPMLALTNSAFFPFYFNITPYYNTYITYYWIKNKSAVKLTDNLQCANKNNNISIIFTIIFCLFIKKDDVEKEKKIEK